MVDTAQARGQALPARGAGARARRRVPLGLLVPAVLLAIWWAVSGFGWVAPNLLPSPLAVVRVIERLALTGDLWFHIEATVGRVAIGFVLGASVATVLGAATGYALTARR